MPNTKFYIAPSVSGNQHSKYPTGNFVPAPTAIVSSVSGSDVTLTFTDNTRGYGTHVLRRASSPAGPYSDVATLSPGVTTHTITGAATGWHHYQITAYYGGLPSAASETKTVGVGVGVSGAVYRFTPPAIGSREFQAVSIPTTGLDTGTGTGQRYVITFAGNDGYLLLCPPSSPINGTVDIETNAQTVVIHGAEFLPDYAVEKVTGPAGNKTVGKVLDIVTTGANNPEIYMYKSLWRTTDDSGRVVWNAGDPINVGGYQSADNTRWPTVYMEQNWIDDLYGFAADTVGHTDCIKSNSGPVKGFRIARNRWGCSYQFFILFQSHNETYGAYPGGTNEFHDNQWYSIDTPTSWAEPIANSLYLSTSYTNQVSNGFYHAYKFNGTGAGGLNGYGTYIDMSGNHQDGNLGGIMSPPVGYGFQLSGSDLVAISGQPPTNRNNDMDWVQGTVYNGTHPKLNDISTRDRPVMRSETGSAYRITTREQLEAIAAPDVIVNTPASFSASASGSTVTINWTDTNSGAAQTVIERSTDSGATWSVLATVAAGTNSYANSGLSDGSYYYRARALIGSTYSSYTSTAIGNVSAGGPLPLYSFVNTAGGKIGGAAPTYQGAFRIPNDSYGAEMFSYSYGAMAYRPGGKIYLGGYRSSEVHASVAELNIPTIVNSTTISALNVATISQSPVDVLAKNSTIYVGNGHFIGGMGVVGSNLIVASYQMYDQGGIGPGYNNDQIQVLRNLDNLAGGQCDGFYHNKTYINGSLGQSSGSFTGWISSIPSEWQTQLGGTHLTGWSSSSARAGVYAMPSGPSAFAITPANWGASASDVPLSTLLNYYPQTNAIGDVYTPTTDDMYNDSRTNSIWTHVSECNFGMIIPGTRTYVVFGSSGGHMSGLAYGDPPYGGYKGHYTIDPYDKYNFYWMFDIDDLIAVKNGTKDPSAVMPYERGQLSLPFQSGYLTKIGGGSFDDTNKDLYLSLYEADNWGSFFSTPIICKYKFAGVN